MRKLKEVADYFKTKIGQKRKRYLGEVTSLMIQRYALTVGETNPLYFDKEYAQQHGYKDIIAPPNMLASIMEWGIGEDEKNLHSDGMAIDEFFLPREFTGLRVMGGGEEKTFYKPVLAGTRVTLTSEIIDTYTRQGKSGLLVFLVYLNTFSDQDNEVLCICKRTMIIR